MFGDWSHVSVGTVVELDRFYPPLGHRHDDAGPMDARGVVHGVVVLAELERLGRVHARLSCGWTTRDTFTCRNCSRRICYCKGHDDCSLCDECCARPKCLGVSP